MLHGGTPRSHSSGSSRSARSFLIVVLLVCATLLVGPLDESAQSQGGQPDLVVTGVRIYVGEWKYGHTINATIQNQGSAFSASFATRIVIDGVVDDTTYLHGTTGSGQSRNVTMFLGEWIPGIRHVNVTTDVFGHISESNEDANGLYEAMTVLGGSDLVIDQVLIGETSHEHSLSLILNNTGLRASGQVGVRVVVGSLLDETQSLLHALPNEQRYLSFNLGGWSSGVQRVQVWVDEEDAFHETDEANNYVDVLYNITTGPDVRVENLTINDNHVVYNEPIFPTLTLANVGTHDMYDLPWTRQFAGHSYDLEWASSLKSGRHDKMGGRAFMPPGIGHHVLRVEIDPERTRGDVTRGPRTYEVGFEVHPPEPLDLGTIHISNETRWQDGNRTERVYVHITAIGDHLPTNVWLSLYQDDTRRFTTNALQGPLWHGGPFTYPFSAHNASWSRLANADGYRTDLWRTFDVRVTPEDARPFRIEATLDDGSTWAVNGTRATSEPIVVVDPLPPPPPDADSGEPPPEQYVDPPPPYQQYTDPPTVQADPGRPVPETEARDSEPEPDLPVALEVVHVDTREDPENVGAHLLRFHVKGLGPGGTSTDLGVIAKVGWQVEVLTSSQDVDEGETAEYVLRLTPPEAGSTSSTITVGAWAEAARAEPIVVNVRSLTVAGAAAGHPVPVWGYVSGGALVAAAAGAWAWVSEPRRYGWLRYLLAMFPAVGGFSRIQGEKVLEHEARERIHQVIDSQPGIHYRALLRELRMSNGRLAHHLQTLEREGLIRTESAAGKLHFYVTGSTAVRGTPLSDRQRALLAMIKKEPGILQSRLPERLGVSRQALHQHLDALRAQNLLLDARYGRTRALYLESDADSRLTVCGGCSSFYDRGPGMVTGVVCPGCGQP